MSDEQIRGHKRRSRTTGSVEDQARLLLERVRTGDLAQERLDLAAYCGHPAAAMASGTPVGDASNLAAWIAGMQVFGVEGLVRAAVAITREVFPIWRRSRHAASDDLFHQALRAAEQWCMEPTQENRERARDLGQDSAGRIDDLPEEVSMAEDRAAALTSWAARAAAGQDLAEATRWVVDLATQLAGTEDLERRVRLELIPWSLGFDDPLRWSAA